MTKELSKPRSKAVYCDALDERVRRQIDIIDVFFHGEYDQYMTVIVSKSWRCRFDIVEYEFTMHGMVEISESISEPLQSPRMPHIGWSAITRCVGSHSITVDYSRVRNVTVREDTLTIDNRNNRKRDIRQQTVNDYWSKNAYEVEIKNEWTTMNIYDITIPKRKTVLFEFHKNYEVSSKYAFTSDGRHFAYVDEWEDGDQRNYPDVNVLRLWTWREIRWERRCAFMMFLAGYGLLKIFNKDLIPSVFTPTIAKLSLESVGDVGDVESDAQLEEEDISVKALFRALQCPNILQHIVYYL